jgi:HAD superfamily hydrolase (TIGR01509 family)
MPLCNHQNWIFDLDGTLTVAAHDFDWIRSELGLRPGEPILEQLEELPAPMATEKHGRLDAIEAEIARSSQAQPGAHAFLSMLYDGAHVKNIGIVTRNNRRNALTTLDACGLSAFFTTDNILGRESCDPKPSPDGIQKLLARWNVVATDTVYVGDYLYDLLAGRAAGTSVVHFDESGANNWPERADFVVNDYAGLQRLSAQQAAP